jgi:hypothetical protein
LRIAAFTLDRQARTVNLPELKIGIISHSTITVAKALQYTFIHFFLYCGYTSGGGANFVCMFKLFVRHMLWKFFSYRKSNPSETAVKKGKEQKKPKGAGAM